MLPRGTDGIDEHGVRCRLVENGQQCLVVIEKRHHPPFGDGGPHEFVLGLHPVDVGGADLLGAQSWASTSSNRRTS